MASASSQAISDYKLFLYMQLHKGDGDFFVDAFPPKTVAFAKVEVTSGDKIATAWFRQERNGLHAEEALLKMPDGPIVKFVGNCKRGEERPVVRIAIYQNYSPCAKCSPVITNFCDTNKWKIDFAFVALHNIGRPSCKYRYAAPEDLKQEQRQNQQKRKCNHCLGGLPVQSVSDAYIAGLYNLQQCGVTVRTFTREDWATLRDHLFQRPSQNYLGFFYFGLGESSEEDNCLADFRQAEDEYMQRDLETILESEVLQRFEKMKVSEQV